MTRTDLQTWLDRYVIAWEQNAPEPIRELFTEDAVYRFHPYDQGEKVVSGREAIIAAWLESPDDPEFWEAGYEPFAVEEDRAVAVGTTRYLAHGEDPARVYHNCFLMRFDRNGRCSEFTEYYVRRPG
jgi:ketosteroid isomerase-like protein